MTAPTDNTSELDEILSKVRATIYSFDGSIEMVVMEDGNLDSLTPLKDALQAYISKKVAAELVRENQKMINTIKKIKGDTDGVSWDGLTRALRHRILELEFAQLTEGSKD